MSLLLPIVLHLVVLHSVDGYEIFVNPAKVTVLHATSTQIGRSNRLITPGARCVVGFVTGKFVSVTETCDVVRDRLEEALR